MTKVVLLFVLINHLFILTYIFGYKTNIESLYCEEKSVI